MDGAELLRRTREGVEGCRLAWVIASVQYGLRTTGAAAGRSITASAATTVLDANESKRFYWGLDKLFTYSWF